MKQATKLEAPDGGWGIIVCIGMALPFVSGLAALSSFGLVFGDFLKDIGAETSAIAFITSAFFCFLSFAGLFSGLLFKRFGLRAVGLSGGFIYFLGSVLQMFVSSTTELLFAFSVLQGLGFGLIIPTSYTTFNNYFVKKRVVWMSFAQTLIGLGVMIYPVVMQLLMDTFGFRGCLAVLAAINSHAILGMLVMQPVKWHMREIPLTDHEMLEQSIPCIRLETPEGQHLTPLMTSRKLSHKFTKEELQMIETRSSSIASLGNWTGPIIVSDASPPMTMSNTRRQSAISSLPASERAAKNTRWQVIVDFLDLKLLQEPIYLNIVLGISFALYSDVAFFTLQPLYLFELGFSKQETANVIAIGAAADLGSRIFLACSAIFVQMSSRHIYLAGTFFTIIARFAFLQVYDFKGMACITAVMGFLRTWIHVPLPLVFAEYLSPEKFAAGYGLFMFLQGNILFAIGPVVGYLRDITKDYILTFHVLSFFMALCTIPWLVEIIYFKLRIKNIFSQLEIENNKNEPNVTSIVSTHINGT